MDQQSPSKSAIPRRGPPLTAIRTDIAQQQQQHQRPVLQKPRPQRIRPPELISAQPENVPLKVEPAKRQTSKTSLRSLFARNKALRDEKKHEATLPTVGERRNSNATSIQGPGTPVSITHTVNSSSTLPTSSQTATPTESTLTPEIPKGVKKTKNDPKSKISSWSPPPLFQAYPQAVKHARLAIPNISAESILRIYASQNKDTLKNQHGHEIGLDVDSAEKKKKEDKDKKSHKRGASSVLGQIALVKKIFILVTAGYILQYAGEGNFDRLPEKVMRLGSTSAAFASDAIPGKPYVIQISQKSNDDGKSPATSGRAHFFSRFGLQGAESRRAIRTLLIVMPSSQDMNAWLVGLRKAIESLGGAKYVAEEESEGPEFRGGPLLNARHSRLFISRKSSLAESNPPSPVSESFSYGFSPTVSIHRKNSYQDDTSTTSTVKGFDRRSTVGPLDNISISSATVLGDSDGAFEKPRNAPVPTQRIRPSPSIPSVKIPVDQSTSQHQPPSSATRQLRKPTASVTGISNRRSYIAYSTTQPDRQGEDSINSARRRSLSRPISMVSNSPLISESSSTPPQSASASKPGSRLSVVRKNSSQTISSEDNNTVQVSTAEPPLTVSNNSQGKAPVFRAESANDSALKKAKRQSLTSSITNSTLTIPTTAGTRTTPTIPPRKYSLTGQNNTNNTAVTSRSQRPLDLGSTSRLSQKSPLPTSQSRRPSVTPKSKPANRLPKSNSELETSTASGSGLARLALGNDRASKVLTASPVTTREAPTPGPRSSSALNHRTRKTAATNATSSISDNASSGADENAQNHGHHRKISTPASSPQTPGTPATPREERSRRSSLIMPQSQQTSPRQRRLQSLSLLPPAPPPDCPLPEVPSNMALRNQVRPQKRPSHPQMQQQTPQKQAQTQLPRPSLPSTPSTQSLTTSASASATNTHTHSHSHERRRSSELRYLHQQMANILLRKQSETSISTISKPPSASAGAAVATALADSTSESPSRNHNGHQI